MAKILNFEELIVWQKSQDLAVQIINEFESSKNYSFKDQIGRAVVSISNNIAEGFDRNYDKEFIRFLRIANGSTSEVKSMIYLAFRLKYIDQTQKQRLLEEVLEIQKMLNSLIKSIAKNTDSF